MLPVNLDRHIFHSPKFEGVVQEAIEFLTGTPIHPLPPAIGFPGVGIYALYYLGSLDLYSHVVRQNQQDYAQPIYVGKAVPAGWRTARASSATESRALYQRLREHTRSIASVENLEVSDFHCRFMILNGIETDLISAVESALIRTCFPLWNTVVDGFGNHDPGKGRYNQARSEWDVLHPGRNWTNRLAGPAPKLERIIAKIQQTRSKLGFS